jgi:hypothetical protein
MSTSISYTCGVPLPSGCVLYTGDIPSFITDAPCDASLDFILEQHAEQIETILASIDLSDLTKGCFTFTGTTVKAFAQETITKVCVLETSVLALESAIDNLNIGSELITIDLQCLTPLAAPCASAVNTYTLLSVLNLLVSEICLIKTTLNL